MTICKNNSQQNYIQRSYTEYFNETQDNNSTQIRGATTREKTENKLKDPVFVTHPWKSFKENSAKIKIPLMIHFIDCHNS